MPITIGQSSGRIIIHDTSQRLRVGYNSGYIITPDDDTPQREEELIERSFDAHNTVQPLDPQQANIEEIRGWIDICEQRHVDQLPAKETMPEARNRDERLLRFIDVRDQCLVETRDPLRYVALSYVWGAARQVKLETSQLAELLIKGSLRDLELPKTIRDSIVFTSQLGHRFLWIDALCILQDDEADKQRHFAQMCDIYSEAVITIVAVSGKDANSGLSRVNCSDTIHDSNETKNTKDSNSSARGWISILDSVWATRAWTFQETLLSRRLLLVLEDKVMLACEHLLFTEGVLKPEPPIVHPRLESFSYRIERRTTLDLYEHVVNSYSGMDLTVEEDCLPAFEGILNKLRPYARSEFIFGLPVTELESALAWKSGSVLADWTSGPAGKIEQGKLCRRRKAVDGQDLNPSWSWAGWAGMTHYNYNIWPAIGMVIAWIVATSSDSESATELSEIGMFNSVEIRAGIENPSKDWFWNFSIYKPGYFTETDSKQRFSNPTGREDQRRNVKFLGPASEKLCFLAYCQSLDLVPTEELNNNYGQRQCEAAKQECTMKCLHILDEEHFHAGMIDTHVLPAQAATTYPHINPTSSDTQLPFALVLAKEARIQEGLQLLVLSRFTGFSNTIEAPHRYNSPKGHPMMDDSLNPLSDNIRGPIEPPFPEAESRTANNDEDQDPPFPVYDPRRYEKNKWYPFFCVLLIEWRDGVAYRLGCGQVHIDAPRAPGSFGQNIVLG